MPTQPSNAPAGQKPHTNKPKKRPRLPPTHKLTKRPLLRPAAAAAAAQPTVYLGARTPFVAAVKRVRRLLQRGARRGAQSALATARAEANASAHAHAHAHATAKVNVKVATGTGTGAGVKDGDAVAAAAASSARVSEAAEEVLVRATGRAIERAVRVALFLQGQADLLVRLRTGTVRGVDDVEVVGGGGEGDEVDGAAGEAGEARVREISVLEVGVSLRG